MARLLLVLLACLLPLALGWAGEAPAPQTDDEYADLDSETVPPDLVRTDAAGEGEIFHAYPDELSQQYAGANGAHRMKEALMVVKVEVLNENNETIDQVVRVTNADDVNACAERSGFTASPSTIGVRLVDIRLPSEASGDWDSVELNSYGIQSLLGRHLLERDGVDGMIYSNEFIRLTILSYSGLARNEQGHLSVEVSLLESDSSFRLELRETDVDSLVYRFFETPFVGGVVDMPSSTITEFNFSDQPFSHRKLKYRVTSAIPINPNISVSGFNYDSDQESLRLLENEGEYIYESSWYLPIEGELSPTGKAYLDSATGAWQPGEANTGFRKDNKLVAEIGIMQTRIKNIMVACTARGAWIASDGEKDPEVPQVTISTTATNLENIENLKKELQYAPGVRREYCTTRYVVKLDSAEEKSVQIVWNNSGTRGFAQKEMNVITGQYDASGVMVNYWRYLRMNKVTVSNGDIRLIPVDFETVPINDGIDGTALRFSAVVKKNEVSVFRVTMLYPSDQTKYVVVDYDFEILGIGAGVDVPLKVYKVVGTSDDPNDFQSRQSVFSVYEMRDFALNHGMRFWRRYGIRMTMPSDQEVSALNVNLPGTYMYENEEPLGKGLDYLCQLALVADPSPPGAVQSLPVFFVKNVFEASARAYKSSPGQIKRGVIIGEATPGCGMARVATHEYGHNFGLNDIEHPGLQSLLMYHLYDNSGSAITSMEILECLRTITP